MKKILHLFIMAVLLIVTGTANAQTDYVVFQGDGNGYTHPTNNCYKWSFNEYVIKYINLPGPPEGYNAINSISFYFTGTTGNSNYQPTYSCDMVVYLKNVSRAEFTNDDRYEPVTANDIYFAGNVTATTEGWVTINLSRPFYYKNVTGNNMLIAIDNNTGSYAGTTNYCNFMTKTMTGGGVQYYSDNSDINPYDVPANGYTVNDVVPALKINHTAINAATMPYYCDFEDATERDKWMLKNTTDNMNAGWYIWGNQNTNHFLMCGGGQDDYQTSGQPVTVLAERVIELSQAEQIAVSFDLNVGGENYTNGGVIENCYDYVMAYLAPYTENWEPATNTTTYTGSSSDWDLPYALHFGSEDLAGTKLTFKNWERMQAVIDNPAPGQKYKLVFVWHNDNSDGDGTAATIDNIQVVDYVEYDLKVGSTMVTSLNCNDIIDSDLVSGHISFNPANNTITMNGATLDTDNGIEINHNYGVKISNPVIELNGQNDILGDVYVSYSSEETTLLTIKGTGNLSAAYMGLYDVDLLAKDCEINLITEETWGLYGYGDNNFTFNNAKVHVIADSYAIGDFTSLNLIDCEIVQPVNALITSIAGYSSSFVCNSDGTAATEVLIDRVEGVAQNESSILNVYPNPANDVIRVNGLNGTEEVNIINTLGQVVKSERLSDGQSINISDLSAGVYMLRSQNSMVKFNVK